MFVITQLGIEDAEISPIRGLPAPVTDFLINL